MDWYYTLMDDKTGLFGRHPKLSAENVIVCLEQEKRTFTFFTNRYNFYDYYKILDEENKCFYEVIRGEYYQKPYFDIDISLDEDRTYRLHISETIIPLLIDSILNHYPMIHEEDILIFNSHGEDKRSFHIVVDNWCVANNKQNKVFFSNVIKTISSDYHQFIDDKMYKSIQQFRVIGSHKWNKTRVKKIDSSCKWKYKNEEHLVFFFSLISSCSHCKMLPSEEIAERKTYNSLEDFDKKDLLKIVNKILKDDFTILDINDTCISLLRLKPSFCSICNRIHEHENPYVYVKDDIVFFNCRRNNMSLEIGQINKISSYDTLNSMLTFELPQPKIKNKSNEEIFNLFNV